MPKKKVRKFRVLITEEVARKLQEEEPGRLLIDIIANKLEPKEVRDQDLVLVEEEEE